MITVPSIPHFQLVLLRGVDCVFFVLNVSQMLAVRFFFNIIRKKTRAMQNQQCLLNAGKIRRMILEKM